ncbi:hypothetical protein ACWEQL_20150 [Kitasatospora sp. NPDC004240]
MKRTAGRQRRITMTTRGGVAPFRVLVTVTGCPASVTGTVEVD